MQSKNITEMCNALKKEFTRFYSFWGNFNPVSPERLRSRIFPAPGNPLASSPNDWGQNGGNPRVTSKYLPLLDLAFIALNELKGQSLLIGLKTSTTVDWRPALKMHVNHNA